MGESEGISLQYRTGQYPRSSTAESVAIRDGIIVLCWFCPDWSNCEAWWAQAGWWTGRRSERSAFELVSEAVGGGAFTVHGHV
jgi:hypothetical protein